MEIDLTKIMPNKRVLSVILILFLLMLIPTGVTVSAYTDQVAYAGEELFYKDGLLLPGGSSIDSADASVSKTIEQLDENEFEVTLQVKTKTDVQTISPQYDASAVLVLDISGSMNRCIECGLGNVGSSAPGNNPAAARVNHAADCSIRTSAGRTTIEFEDSRLYTMQQVASAFLDNFIADAQPGDQRWISLVTYGTNARIVHTWVDINSSATALAETKDYINNLRAIGGTYTQGGLTLARNLYRNDPVGSSVVNNNLSTIFKNGNMVDNRYVILFTDGEPTYRHTNSTSTASYTNAAGVVTSSNAGNGNTVTAANRNNTVNIANQIKNGFAWGASYTSLPAKLYTVALLTDGDSEEEETDGGTETDPGDTTITNQAWLRNHVASKDDGYQYAYTASNADELLIAFEKISESIRLQSDVWLVVDPMADNIIFGGLSGGDLPNVVIGDNGIVWTLRNVVPTHDDGTVKTYILKYTVTLDTLNVNYDSLPSSGMPVNEPTTLRYANPGETTSHDIDFTIPRVRPLSGSFAFGKEDATTGDPLKDVVFTLESVGGEKTLTATSNASGRVEFSKIPSGHSYILTETATVEDYRDHDTTYKVTVTYGKVLIVTNDSDETEVYNSDNATNNFTVLNYAFTYSYRVEYYKDSVSDENKLGEEDGNIEFRVGYQPTAVDIAGDLGADWLNSYRPATGYGNGTVSGAYPIITVDTENNVIRVVYVTQARENDPKEFKPDPDPPEKNTPQTGDVSDTMLLVMCGTSFATILGSVCVIGIRKKRSSMKK